MTNVNACINCDKQGYYHDEKGIVFCESCYWEKDEKRKQQAKQRSFKTYTGTSGSPHYVTESTTYIKCPHCGLGDSCGTDGCVSQINGFYHPEGKSKCSVCLEEIKRKKETNKQKIKQALSDEWQQIVDEIYPLSQKEFNQLTQEDYKKIKKLQRQANTLSQKTKNDLILKSLVEDCLNTLKELEKKVPKRSKTTGNYENCFHRDIHWNNSSNESPYCANCGTTEDNHAKFLKALCRFYYRKIQEWFRSNNLKISSSTLGENNYSLYRQLINHDFAEVTEINQAYRQIAEKHNIDNPNNNTHTHTQRERERERERAKFTTTAHPQQ